MRAFKGLPVAVMRLEGLLCANMLFRSNTFLVQRSAYAERYTSPRRR